MSEIKMKYKRRASEARFVSDMYERWKTKYDSKVGFSLVVLSAIFCNWIVWFYNGFVAEMIITVPLSLVGSFFLVGFIINPTIEWIYVKRHWRLYAKEQKFYNDQEEFKNFVNKCRGNRNDY